MGLSISYVCIFGIHVCIYMDAILMWPLCILGFVCAYVEKHNKNMWGQKYPVPL